MVRDVRVLRGWSWAVAAVAAVLIGWGVASSAPPSEARRPGEVDGLLAAEVEQAPPPPAWNLAQPFHVTVTGTDGQSRAIGEGRTCDGGAATQDLHLLLPADVAAGPFAHVPATVRANLGVTGGNRLEPADSHVTVGDERGTVRFHFDGPACPATNLGPADQVGRAVAGGGSLTLVGATGAYREATLARGATYHLATALTPGADNGWDLDLAGQLAVLRPGLTVSATATWANAVDYAARIVTVDYAVSNPGPGDSFATALTGIATPAGVTRLAPVGTVALGDLLAGDTAHVAVRYQLAALGPPCNLVILGCHFAPTLTFSVPDALDVPATRSLAAAVTAPTLPPPA